MGRIYPRGKKKILWYQHHGKRESLHTTDKTAADLAAREIERAYADPAYAASKEVTLEFACQEWLRVAPTMGNRSNPPSAGTFEMYSYHLGHFKRIFGGETRLVHIDASAWDEYVRTRRSETIGKSETKLVGANTVSKEKGTLRSVLRFALRQGWYHRSLEQVFPATIPTDYVPLKRALTEPQIPALLLVLEEPRAAICAFLIALGADWCAVERARAEDFDFERRVVLVRGSKNRRRFDKVPIFDMFEPLVKRAHSYLVKHDKFPAWGNAVRDLAAACVRAELPRVTPRDLRRTFGKILRAKGIPTHLIGRVLRNVDGRMAEIAYAQLEPETAGALIGDLLGGSRPPKTKSKKSRKKPAAASSVRKNKPKTSQIRAIGTKPVQVRQQSP